MRLHVLRLAPYVGTEIRVDVVRNTAAPGHRVIYYVSSNRRSLVFHNGKHNLGQKTKYHVEHDDRRVESLETVMKPEQKTLR